MACWPRLKKPIFCWRIIPEANDGALLADMVVLFVGLLGTDVHAALGNLRSSAVSLLLEMFVPGDPPAGFVVLFHIPKNSAPPAFPAAEISPQDRKRIASFRPCSQHFTRDVDVFPMAPCSPSAPASTGLRTPSKDMRN